MQVQDQGLFLQSRLRSEAQVVGLARLTCFTGGLAEGGAGVTTSGGLTWGACGNDAGGGAAACTSGAGSKAGAGGAAA